MKIEDKSALLVIDIQQEDFVGMKEDDTENPAYICIRNAKRCWMFSGQKDFPLSKSKRYTAKIMWISGVNWTVRKACIVWKTPLIRTMRN